MFTGNSEKMFLPQILVISFGAVFGLSSATAEIPGIPYKDLNRPKIFDSKPTNYEVELYKAFSGSLESSGKKMGLAIAGAFPGISEAAPILDELYDLLSPGSEWQKTVARTIDDVTDKKELNKEVGFIRGKLDAIYNSLTPPPSRGPKPDPATVNWDTHCRIDEILNHFAEHKSVLKKYALVGSPLLLELARFVASLSAGINDHNMSCKIRNILLEYRQRAVDARFDKITSKWTVGLKSLEIMMGKNYEIPLIRSNIFSLRYTKKGYGGDVYDQMKCKKYPKKNGVPEFAYVLDDEYDNEFYYGVNDLGNYDGIRAYEREFNSMLDDIIRRERIIHNPPPKQKCAADYLGFIRYSVEKMFPVELFESFTSNCGRNDLQEPSGKLANSLQNKKQIII